MDEKGIGRDDLVMIGRGRVDLDMEEDWTGRG